MRIRIYILFLLTGLPVISGAQDNLVLKEISFIFDYKEVSGTIGDFRSSSIVDVDEPKNSYFEGSVSVASLKTGNFLRDWAIKGRKYFNEDQYPRILFRSTEVSSTADGLKVTGLLTMKGNTNPLVIHFKMNEAGLIGQAELFTSDYGISIKKERAENKVLVTLEFQTE
ncbi:YceI family protein [Flavobacteriaceae bacterium D16]|nr:YceI family protein [Flavobacteriaceae bacterium D16]